MFGIYPGYHGDFEIFISFLMMLDSNKSKCKCFELNNFKNYFGVYTLYFFDYSKI